jgi:putative endonuclease
VWFVYIVRCSDDSLYIGETNDVPSRVSRHNDGGGSTFTGGRRPVRLVYTETVNSRDEALVREQQLKRWTRAKKEALIESSVDFDRSFAGRPDFAIKNGQASYQNEDPASPLLSIQPRTTSLDTGCSSTSTVFGPFFHLDAGPAANTFGPSPSSLISPQC